VLSQLSITLRRVSNSQELAKIDPDTGLQDVIRFSPVHQVALAELSRYAENKPRKLILAQRFPWYTTTSGPSSRRS
jgi:hypothetical protein